MDLDPPFLVLKWRSINWSLYACGEKLTGDDKGFPPQARSHRSFRFVVGAFKAATLSLSLLTHTLHFFSGGRRSFTPFFNSPNRSETLRSFNGCFHRFPLRRNPGENCAIRRPIFSADFSSLLSISGFRQSPIGSDPAKPWLSMPMDYLLCFVW